MRYRTKDDFHVTVSVPCPCCEEFVEEKTIQARSRYIYGFGWCELTSCQPCFDKTLADAQAAADEKIKSNRSSIYPEGWDYV